MAGGPITNSGVAGVKAPAFIGERARMIVEHQWSAHSTHLTRVHERLILLHKATTAASTGPLRASR